MTTGMQTIPRTALTANDHPTPEAEALNELLTQMPQLASFLGEVPRDELYLGLMIKLVQKTHNWANLPPLSEQDLGQRAMDWHDELEPEIPIERLPEVVKRARKNHKSVYAINLYEITQAWEEIQTEDKTADLRRAEQQRTSNPISSCKFSREHINADGEVEIVNFFDTTKEVVAPCKECRPKAFDAWRERFVEKNKGTGVQMVNPGKILDAKIRSLNKTEAPVAVSAEKAARLIAEYNAQVHRLSDKEFWIKGEIIYDEKMKLFRHMHRTDITYTADEVSKFIESYRRSGDDIL